MQRKCQIKRLTFSVLSFALRLTTVCDDLASFDVQMNELLV